MWGDVLRKGYIRKYIIEIWTQERKIYLYTIIGPEKREKKKKFNWKCQFVLIDHEYKYIFNFANCFHLFVFFHYKEK